MLQIVLVSFTNQNKGRTPFGFAKETCCNSLTNVKSINFTFNIKTKRFHVHLPSPSTMTCISSNSDSSSAISDITCIKNVAKEMN